MGRYREWGHKGLGREAGIGLQRKETGNGCRKDLFLLVCRIKAAVCRLGSWMLMYPSQYPNT